MKIILGLLIGFAIGGTGVGGGTLTAPMLILLMGYPPRVAVATALLFASAVKIWASATYLYKKQVNFEALRYLLYGGLPGAILGACMLDALRTTGANNFILAIVGAVVTTSAVFSITDTRKDKAIPDHHSQLQALPIFSFPIGMESGFSSAGTGALGTILLFAWTDLAPPVVVGTDLVFGFIVCAIGGSIHALRGNCDWNTLATMIPAGIMGSFIGIQFGQGLPTGILRKTVLICVAAIGIWLLVRGMRGLL